MGRGKKWDIEETEKTCLAYVQASNNPAVGSAQKADRFWAEVQQKLADSRPISDRLHSWHLQTSIGRGHSALHQGTCFPVCKQVPEKFASCSCSKPYRRKWKRSILRIAADSLELLARRVCVAHITAAALASSDSSKESEPIERCILHFQSR